MNTFFDALNYLIDGGAHFELVSVVKNEYSDSSSNPGRDCLNFTLG